MNSSRSLTLLLLFAILFSGCQSGSYPDHRLLSPEKGSAAAESDWERDYWTQASHYRDTTIQGADTRVLLIESDSLTRDRWYRKVEVYPYSDYELTGAVRTVNVFGEPGAGAGLRLGKIDFEGDTVLTGTTDWVPIRLRFHSGGEDSFMIECLLGKHGAAKGKVFFDDLQLRLIHRRELDPKIQINLADRKESISPLIYGQFIEHMGKSIYGGLWAEILEDRKFYYLPGTTASPWKTRADTTRIRIDSSHSYSRGDLPVFSVKGSLQLEQGGFPLEEKGYTGRLVYKVSPGIDSLKVALEGGGGNNQYLSVKARPGGFTRLPFEFHPGSDSQDGKLKISFTGTGEVTLAAASLMPADNVEGFRPDVLQLMKKLNAPVYRWPGGNFVSGYDWRDGIGDPDKRPTRYERAWKGLEYNDVGIHEFMNLCRLLGAEANIAVNTGLGTAEMAAAEVAYVNGDRTTKMGALRAKHGHPEPYNVHLWAVGNEMFGDWQLGHVPVADYVKKHNRVARAMWQQDPDIALIGVGYPGKWNDMMYTHSADYMTYISEHFYRQDWHAGGLLTHVSQIPEAIREIADEHRRARREIPGIKEKNIKIALDEWNYWYGPHIHGLLGTRYFLKDALGIAAGINELSRQSDIFYMANYAQTINVIGAIKVNDTTSWMEGTGMVLSLYREQFGDIPVAITGAPEPLDVAAAIDIKTRTLRISVVNATHEPLTLEIALEAGDVFPAGRMFTITGKHPSVYNDAEDKHRIRLEERTISFNGGTLEVPKEAAVIYSFDLKNKIP